MFGNFQWEKYGTIKQKQKLYKKFIESISISHTVIQSFVIMAYYKNQFATVYIIEKQSNVKVPVSSKLHKINNRYSLHSGEMSSQQESLGEKSNIHFENELLYCQLKRFLTA